MKKPEILSDKEIISILNKLRPAGIFHVTTLSRDFKRDVYPLLEAQRGHDYKEMLEGLKMLALQAIADEPEFPSSMPDELWQELGGNREQTERAMRNTVRLTKNIITDRFLQSLQSQLEEIP